MSKLSASALRAGSGQSEMQKPDRIEPQAPPEKPQTPSPDETPPEEPPEIEPPLPDEDEPDPGLPEIRPLPE